MRHEASWIMGSVIPNGGHDGHVNIRYLDIVGWPNLMLKWCDPSAWSAIIVSIVEQVPGCTASNGPEREREDCCKSVRNRFGQSRQFQKPLETFHATLIYVWWFFSDLVVECRKSHWISSAEDVLLHPMATWKVDRRGAGQLGMLGSLAFAILIAYIRPFDVCVFWCLILHMKLYEKHLSTHWYIHWCTVYILSYIEWCNAFTSMTMYVW
jgi:hypothetical protein